VPKLIDELKRSAIDCAVLYLVADDQELLRRFAETRRAHPLGRQGETLREAIASERRLLEPIAEIADQVIDTSRMGVHQLREVINRRVDPRSPDRLSIQFESFGFKHGIPGDADFVFDVRSLPNPHWETALRKLNGRDPAVIEYLAGFASVRSMIADLTAFLEKRVGEFSQANRSYLTIAIGCTGGQHRSVYIAEQLAEHFRKSHPQALTRHDSLQKN